MKEVLARARDQIIRYGLAHEAFSAEAGWVDRSQITALCVMGAISWAVTGNPRNLRDPEVLKGWAILQEALSEISTLRLIPWNDEKTFRPDGTWYFCRTIDEVIALFDRAAELA